MQRNQVTKLVLIIALIVLAAYWLYPSFQLAGLQDQEAAYVNDIHELTGISKSDIDASLAQGDLISLIRENTDGDTLQQAVDIAEKAGKLYTKVEKVEARAIRQGLDLQGGTYLVYEADLPQLLNNLAQNPDDRLEEIIEETRVESETEGVEFFAALQQNFNDRDVRLNRYFGRKGQTDNDIINDLQEEAEDAVDRTLEVLRNRIDQFGVSEPSITKQGDRRIEIELAGIQNIQRAKDIIGTTALLEFKLVKEADVTWSLLNDIDRVMRARQSGMEVDELDTSVDSVAVDSASFQDGSQADETEVSLDDLFGDNAETETTADADTSLLVDENTFSERPFTSLLRQMQGRNVITLPTRNMRAVQRILQLPEVQDVIPSDSEFLFGLKPFMFNEEEYQQMYLVKEEPELQGKLLTDANVQIGGGSQSFNAGEPTVQMSLNSEGTKIFARVTGMNVGRQLAIVLDGRVPSAPNINEKIPSGSAVISGSFTMEEAQDLALILRAGALPAPVHVITENTVGPSLGHDSIEKGRSSALIGLVLVIIFMVVYYKGSGLVADFALILNIIFVMAVMAGFHATLTLPGIAGIILTVGMAVDANVLIFERIREEMRTGKTIRASIDSGYDRAFRTILDANVTTLITAIVLYSFGTGPIRGFALTLSIGIVASMFTAIVVTRLIFDIITTRYAIKKLSI